MPVGIASLPTEETVGASIYFGVEVEEGYTDDFTVTANDEELEPVNDVYSFVLEEDTTIKINDGTLLTYDITYQNTEGATILTEAGETPAATASYGTVLDLIIDVADGYAGEPELFMNGVELEAVDDVYSVTVTSDITFTVSGVYKAMTGEGTSQDPYIIYNKENLIAFRDQYNSLASSPEDLTYVELAADIDLGGAEWQPLGTSSVPFCGVFNGNGYSISNFEITQVDTSVNYGYGFFGTSYLTSIYDLNLSGDITINDVSPESSEQAIYAGLLVGLAQAVDIYDVKASGDIDVASSYAVQVSAGGLVGAGSSYTGYAVGITASSFTGDISVTGGTYSSTAGGIIGLLSSSTGILYIQSVEVDAGTISADGDVGGVSSQLPYYTSVSYSVISVDKLASDSGDVAGVSAFNSYETAILGNIVDVKSFETTGESDPITAYVYEDQYANNTADLGTAVYNNYYLSSDDTVSSIAGDAISSADLTADFISSIGISSQVFDVQAASLPAMKADVAESLNTSVSIDNDGELEQVSVYNGIYDPIDYTELAKQVDGKLCSGLYYDEAMTIAYRYYVPLTGEQAELFMKYTDVSSIVGLYTGYCSASTEEAAITTDLTLEFKEDGTAIFVNEDFESIPYTYWTDGINFTMSSPYSEAAFVYDDGTFRYQDTSTSDGSYYYNFRKVGNDFYGYYKASNGVIIIIRNDSTLYYDGQEVPYEVSGNEVTFSANSYDFTIAKDDEGNFTYSWNDGYDEDFGTIDCEYYGFYPDYSESNFLGTFYLGLNTEHNDEIEFLADGNMNIEHYYSASAVYGPLTGGYREMASNSLNVYYLYFNCDDLAYYPTQDVLVGTFAGQTQLLSRSPITARYDTTDGYSIFVTEDKTYITSGDSLRADATVTGDFSEGSLVTINDNDVLHDYTVVDGALVSMESVDYSIVAGEYTGQDSLQNDIDLVLNEDRTGTFNGETINYTFDTKNVVFTLDGIEYTLTFDEENSSFSGSYLSGEQEVTITLEKKQEEINHTIYGTWECTNIAGTMELVINEDGTVTYNGETVSNLTLTETTLTFDVGDYTYTFTYDPETDTMTGSYSDPYEGYNFNFTSIVRVA